MTITPEAAMATMPRSMRPAATFSASVMWIVCGSAQIMPRKRPEKKRPSPINIIMGYLAGLKVVGVHVVTPGLPIATQS